MQPEPMVPLIEEGASWAQGHLVHLSKEVGGCVLGGDLTGGTVRGAGHHDL